MDISVTPTQNLSDAEEDEDDLPLARFITKDIFIWKKAPPISTTSGNQTDAFSEVIGPTNISQDIESPVEIFGCLIDEEMIEHMVFQTNLYATQRQNTAKKMFVSTTAKEIKIFIAINILSCPQRIKEKSW